MIFEWCEQKRALNFEKHGLDFKDAEELWSSETVINEDVRTDYGEERFICFGIFINRIVTCVFTIREGDIIRIISFRKANKREARHYETSIKNKT